MNKDVLATWPKDFETDLPIVPPGEFTDFSEYPSSTQPATVRKLPVLRGYFDEQRFELNATLPAHIGWGSVQLGRALALTFRIQLGPNVLYWLANPSDPHVWNVVDKWASAKTMVLAAEFRNAPVLIMRRDFELHPAYSALRNHVKAAPGSIDFVTEVTRLLAADEVKRISSSDIASYPQLRQVQGCMVRTQHTGGVAMALHEGTPGPNGPVADAVSALMQSMLKPNERRH